MYQNVELYSGNNAPSQSDNYNLQEHFITNKFKAVDNVNLKSCYIVFSVVLNHSTQNVLYWGWEPLRTSGHLLQ